VWPVPSKWAKLVRQGHEIAWEFDKPGGAYTGRTLIGGEIITPSRQLRGSYENNERFRGTPDKWEVLGSELMPLSTKAFLSL
jgi:hypothetical protein